MRHAACPAAGHALPAPTFIDGASPAAVAAPQLTILGPDDTLRSASLQLRPALAGDVLGLVAGAAAAAGLTASWAAAPAATLTLAGNAPLDTYVHLLRTSLTFFTPDRRPDPQPRAVLLRVTSGSAVAHPSNGGDYVKVATVNVRAVNDPPVLAVPPAAAAGGLRYLEGQADGGTLVAPELSITDVDNSTLTEAVVRVMGAFEAGKDVLTVDDAGSHAGLAPPAWDGAKGELTLANPSSPSPMLDHVDEAACLAAAVAQYGGKVTATRAVLVAGDWDFCPRGCSVLATGDWAAHFNRRAAPLPASITRTAFTQIVGRSCYGRNELPSQSGLTVAQAKAHCIALASCVSFEQMDNTCAANCAFQVRPLATY